MPEYYTEAWYGCIKFHSIVFIGEVVVQCSYQFSFIRLEAISQGRTEEQK